MNEHDGAEQSPCATLSVDMKHPKNLKKANASNGARRKHLTIAA